MEGSIDSLVEELEERLRSLIGEEGDETRRFLLFVSLLSRMLEERGLGRIIVTGGFAVEVYTGRVYRTMDVDIIVERPEAAELLDLLLSEIGERIGRGYLPRWAELASKSIDLVATAYDRPVEPVELEVDGGRVYLDPPEALIATYLAGWKYWGSTDDRDKALWLLAATRRIVDPGLLRRLAEDKDVLDKLDELQKLLREALGRRP